MATKKKSGGGSNGKKPAAGPDDGLAEGVVIGEATSGTGASAEAGTEGVGTATTVEAGTATQPPVIGYATLLDTVGNGLTELIATARANRASRDAILADAEATESVLRETLGVTETFVAAYKAEAGLTQPMEAPPVKRGRGRPRKNGNGGSRPAAASRRQNRRTPDGQPTNREVIRTLARRRQSRRFTAAEVKELFAKEGRSSPGTVLYEMKNQTKELKSVGRGEYEYVGE